MVTRKKVKEAPAISVTGEIHKFNGYEWCLPVVGLHGTMEKTFKINPDLVAVKTSMGYLILCACTEVSTLEGTVLKRIPVVVTELNNAN